MENPRKYGQGPFRVAVVHGGPGAPGEMAAVAKELSWTHGVLEPLQTKDSVAGQIRELEKMLEQNGARPMRLIGWSWGAWLSYLVAARNPTLVEKLILIGSGPFEEKYAAQVMQTRLRRLSKKERTELQALEESLGNPTIRKKAALFARFGHLFDKTDTYDGIEAEPEAVEVQLEIYQRVWKEAAELRRSGELLRAGKRIQCPVAAIHGAYDPHPYQGVEKPMSRTLARFRFWLLPKCGHRPWIEKSARGRFFEILREELAAP